MKKIKNIELPFSSKIRDEFKITAYTTRGFCLSTWISIKIAFRTAISLSMPKMNNWQILVKDSIFFLMAPVVEALDVVLDGVYVVRLARNLNRFWIHAFTIRLMLNLYMIAVFKDIILHLIFICTFFRRSLSLSRQTKFKISFIGKVIGFFTEDTAQSILQYFYFEKYQMDGDVIIIFKFVVGLLVTGKSLLTLALAYNQTKNQMKKIDFITAKGIIIFD